ncbi:MAG: DUF5684 domain-containing protein [bacterium]
MYETTYDGGAMATYMWLIMAFVYFYFAFAQYKIAQKVSRHDIAWWGFIPILNFFQIVQLAQKPWYWFLLFLVPFINIFAFAWIWAEVARVREKPTIWGVLMIFPPISFVAVWILASGPEKRPVFPVDQKVEKADYSTAGQR